MEQIYTIPVNEAFEAAAKDAGCGCPFCMLYNKLEDNELDLILGASMMEPAVRIRTNKEGFCKIHYDMMLTRKNRLSMALTLESHLAEIAEKLAGGTVFGNPAKKIAGLEDTCYVCSRVEFNFKNMTETAVLLWETDEDFRAKFALSPFFCLPHYARLDAAAKNRLGKSDYSAFGKISRGIVKKYADELLSDVSWFCKKFDYRYGDEPWHNSKDAVERAVRFLRSDMHNPPRTRKPGETLQ